MHGLPRLVLLTASCLASPVRAEALRWPAPLLPKMENLPRLVVNDPAARMINADPALYPKAMLAEIGASPALTDALIALLH